MLNALVGIKNRLTQILNGVLIVLVGLIVVDVVLGVITRYIVGKQVQWTGELACFLLIWISLIGGAVAFGTKGHLGVDYFVGKLHPDVRKIMAIVVHVIVLFFAVAIFLYGGSRIVINSLLVEQTTPALHWKMGLVYLALPISGLFMVIYTIENLIETCVTPAAELHDADAEEEVA
ncbi:MAG: TRAP transporter small permease [Pontiellaceae bacterium]|nr:TRAP transporter small permease [Pontiellaceae bacterium]